MECCLGLRSNRRNCEWEGENWEWGGGGEGGGGGLQNEAREEEKCFIIRNNPFDLSAATKGIRGVHRDSIQITKNIKVYVQCSECQWLALKVVPNLPFLMNSSIDTTHYTHLIDFKDVLHCYLYIKGDNVITFSLFMSVCICTSRF